MKKGIFDVKKLAAYISKRYSNKYSRKISNIKLQKCLYFLFAFWGAFIRKSKVGLSEIKFDTYSEYLFNARIEAWIYGPVVPEVYTLQQNEEIENYFDANMMEGKELEQDTINSLLDDLFEISDFKLVSISHDDNCWKNKFDNDDTFHNNPIDLESIINEYTMRESL